VTRTQELEDRLHRVLHEAADQLPVSAPAWEAPARAPRRLWGRHPGRQLGSVAAVALVLLTVIVTVGAIVLVGRHSHASPSSTRPAGGSSRAALISLLDVLRRPQTRADLNSPQLSELEHSASGNTPLRGPVDLPLVRLAGWTPWGQKIFLVPFKPPTPIQADRPRDALGLLNRVARHEGERLEIVSPGLVPLPVSDFGATAGQIERQGVLAEATRACGHAESCLGVLRFVGVVPSVVARVTVSFGTTVAAAVHQNIFAVQLRVPTGDGEATGPYFTWYSNSGRVIKRIGPTGNVIQTPAATVSPKRPPLPETLLRSFHVFQGLTSNQGRFITNVGGEQLFVVPQNKQVCLMWRLSAIASIRAATAGYPLRSGATGGDCVPNRMALAGEMSPLNSGPSGETVIGLAPNGNTTVTLTVLDRKTKVVSKQVVNVSENVYVAQTPHLFETVTLKDANGALRTWHIPDGG
jgi:hypothetical protein